MCSVKSLPPRNRPLRCRSGHACGTAEPAIRPEIRTSAPCRIASFPRERLSPSTMLGRKIVSGTSGKQFAHHVLAEFLGARIRIVVGPIPFDRRVLGHHFVAALARHRHRADLAKTGAVRGSTAIAARQLQRLPAFRADSHSGSFFRICGSARPRSESPIRSCRPGGHIRQRPGRNCAIGEVAAKNRIFASAAIRRTAGNGRCNCRACHRRSSASRGSRPRTSRFRVASCRSSRLAATCAPMYPVEPVRNIATLLRLSPSSCPCHLRRCRFGWRRHIQLARRSRFQRPALNQRIRPAPQRGNVNVDPIFPPVKRPPCHSRKSLVLRASTRAITSRRCPPQSRARCAE